MTRSKVKAGRNAAALYNLGYFYYTGEGVRKNLKLADLFFRSAVGGYDEAKMRKYFDAHLKRFQDRLHSWLETY